MAAKGLNEKQMRARLKARYNLRSDQIGELIDGVRINKHPHEIPRKFNKPTRTYYEMIDWSKGFPKLWIQKRECPTCDGEGTTQDGEELCITCDGNGVLKVKQYVQADIHSKRTNTKAFSDLFL